MLCLDNLNPQQRSAAVDPSRALLVLAGPGAGKTFTMLQRIFYFIEREHIPPEQILVVTFTKDAASSMQRRFLKDSIAPLPVNFGTFHSIFYSILCHSDAGQSLQILYDKEKQFLLKDAVSSFCAAKKLNLQSGEFSSLSERLCNAIGFYKNTGDRKASANLLKEEYRTSFAELFDRYESKRMERNKIDFDDMIYSCLHYLKNNTAELQSWKSKIRAILIDEFQDINPMQYEVLRLLCDENTYVFAVGDDDQSIYGFRGSAPSIIKRYEQDFHAKRLYLLQNYRSTSVIVKNSLEVIKTNSNRYEKDLFSDRAGGDFRLWACADRTEQVEKCISLIKEEEKTVILFRTNIAMNTFSAMLNKKGIIYEMKGQKRNLYEHFVVQDILAYLKLCKGCGTMEDLIRIINRPQRYLNREWFSGYTQPMEALQRVSEFLTQQKDLPYAKERKSAVENLQNGFRFCMEKKLHLVTEYIVSRFGYLRYLENDKGLNDLHREEYLEVLQYIRSEIKRPDTDIESLSEQLKGTEMNRSIKTENNEKINLTLMTVHASKGLEFEHVIIPDCNENVFPHGRFPDPETVEEERRLFYVAMTRAAERLDLIYLTGTKGQVKIPSRFITQLIKK